MSSLNACVHASVFNVRLSVSAIASIAEISGAGTTRRGWSDCSQFCSFISQSKGGFPVSALQARKGGVCVCSSFPMLRIP